MRKLIEAIRRWFNPPQITDDEYYNLGKSYDRTSQIPVRKEKPSFLKKSIRSRILNLKPKVSGNITDGITPKQRLNSLLGNTHNSMGLTQPLRYVSHSKKAATTNSVKINPHQPAACSSIFPAHGKQLMKEKQVYPFGTQTRT